MGAQEFWVEARGANAQEAFSTAVREAKHEHGHGGYTGTIAEKYQYTLFLLPAQLTAKDVGEWLTELSDRQDDTSVLKDTREPIPGIPTQHLSLAWRIWRSYDDKFGPAVCLPNGEGCWVFCGWASS